MGFLCLKNITNYRLLSNLIFAFFFRMNYIIPFII